MKGLIPFGSMTISGPGSQTQLLGTTAALFALFSAAGGSNGPATTNDDGDPAVWPDKANNRLLLETPGVYDVAVVLSGTVDAAQDIVLSIAKNGVVIPDLVTRQRWTNAVKNTQDLKGLLVLTAADNPGTIEAKTAYDASAGAGKPNGGFGGAGGFPKVMVPVQLYINSLAGTPTVTAEYCQFLAKRLG